MAANANTLYLMRDVLDKLLLDRKGIPLGRADGILLSMRGERSRPEIVQIEVGLPTLARRLGRPWGSIASAVSKAFGIRWRRSVRVPWSKVRRVAKEVTLDLAAENSPLLVRERWLRDHIIRRLPGSDLKESNEKRQG
jgi:hypothetical protein